MAYSSKQTMTVFEIQTRDICTPPPPPKGASVMAFKSPTYLQCMTNVFQDQSTDKLLFLHLAPPVIDRRLSLTPVYSFIGYQKEVTIACVFSGYPTPLVKMVNTSSGQEVAQGNRSASFKITTDSDNDFGSFNCTAENQFGMKHFLVELKVAGMLHSVVSCSN